MTKKTVLNSKLEELSIIFEEAALNYLSFCKMNKIGDGFERAQSLFIKSHQRSKSIGIDCCNISKKCIESSPKILKSMNSDGYFVGCSICGIRGPNGIDHQKAVSLWNDLMQNYSKGMESFAKGL